MDVTGCYKGWSYQFFSINSNKLYTCSELIIAVRWFLHKVEIDLIYKPLVI
jgi:uncharacterized protein YycO